MKCQNTIFNISIKLLGLDFMTEVYLHIQAHLSRSHLKYSLDVPQYYHHHLHHHLRHRHRFDFHSLEGTARCNVHLLFRYSIYEVILVILNHKFLISTMDLP